MDGAAPESSPNAGLDRDHVRPGRQHELALEHIEGLVMLPVRAGGPCAPGACEASRGLRLTQGVSCHDVGAAGQLGDPLGSGTAVLPPGPRIPATGVQGSAVGSAVRMTDLRRATDWLRRWTG